MAGGESRNSNKAAVQATNDDASASKLSCVKKGYIKDDYVHLFVRRPVRRSPIINRGYFARWATFRKFLNQFLSCETKSNDGQVKKQILSLGAGFDTTYFQLQDEGKAPHLYVEVDFKEVTCKKATIIETSAQLRGRISESATICREKGEVISDQYKLLPIDLRDIQSLNDLISAHMDPRIRVSLSSAYSVFYRHTIKGSNFSFSCPAEERRAREERGKWRVKEKSQSREYEMRREEEAEGGERGRGRRGERKREERGARSATTELSIRGEEGGDRGEGRRKQTEKGKGSGKAERGRRWKLEEEGKGRGKMRQNRSQGEKEKGGVGKESIKAKESVARRGRRMHPRRQKTRAANQTAEANVGGGGGGRERAGQGDNRHEERRGDGGSPRTEVSVKRQSWRRRGRNGRKGQDAGAKESAEKRRRKKGNHKRRE
ncbi:leucine carboxyl methyltransferase 1 homolog isoform X1 [Tanacetum coccineum]